MNSIRISLYLWLTLLTSPVFAQSAIGVLDQFFAKQGVENKAAIYTGEMITDYLDQPTLGEILPDNADKAYCLLQQKDHQAIYAVALSEGESYKDFYFTLKKENGVWKIASIRSLALPSLFFKALDELENNNNRTEEQEYLYQNMRLTTQTDTVLKQYLIDHITQFKTLEQTAHTNLEQANTLAREVFIDNVYIENNRVYFLIGGLIDNRVGYFYLLDEGIAPVIDGVDYIYIEQITDRWYLYKTT